MGKNKPPEQRILTFNQKARFRVPVCEKREHHSASVTTDWVGGRNWAILQVDTLPNNSIIDIHLTPYFKELENPVKY